jgi:hypothetical protein
MTRNGAVLHFSGPFAARDGRRDLTASDTLGNSHSKKTPGFSCSTRKKNASFSPDLSVTKITRGQTPQRRESESP